MWQHGRVPKWSVACLTGKIINTNGDDPELSSLPKFDVVNVGDKKVLLTGLCTQDTSIYSAKGCPIMRPFLESSVAAWQEASRHQTLDIMVPMTHQLISEDCELALQYQTNDTLSGKVVYSELSAGVFCGPPPTGDSLRYQSSWADTSTRFSRNQAEIP